MEGMRIGPPGSVALWVPCCRCGGVSQSWDRIADKAYCPNCEEAIIVGEAPPLIERMEKKRCTICACSGTVPYVTFPHNALHTVEMDLCPEHLRGLMGRRLGSHAFSQLRRQLQQLSVRVADIFLLHEAFYDTNGRALQPAGDPL
jgi:hypothetical protein